MRSLPSRSIPTRRGPCVARALDMLRDLPEDIRAGVAGVLEPDADLADDAVMRVAAAGRQVGVERRAGGPAAGAAVGAARGSAIASGQGAADFIAEAGGRPPRARGRRRRRRPPSGGPCADPCIRRSRSRGSRVALYDLQGEPVGGADAVAGVVPLGRAHRRRQLVPRAVGAGVRARCDARGMVAATAGVGVSRRDGAREADAAERGGEAGAGEVAGNVGRHGLVSTAPLLAQKISAAEKRGS